MLPKLYRQELLNWVESLKSLEKLFHDEKDDFEIVKSKWGEIQDYLKTKIMTLHSDNLDTNEQGLFQPWQTETYRYIRLLNTDFLFYESAKQLTTKESRFFIIQQRLKDTIILTESYLLTTHKDKDN